MMQASRVPTTRRELKRIRLERRRRRVAAILAPVIALTGIGAGMLIAAPATAAGPAPVVSVTASETYLAGEDVTIGISIGSGLGAGEEYNLSLGVLLPADVTVVGTGSLGTPFVYPLDPLDRSIPGVYGAFSGSCEALGLESDPGPGNYCLVPEGKQYLVFQNISDLPEGATTSHSLRLRPDAGVFPVGAEDLDVRVTAYTSGDERFVPVFPGSKSVAAGDAHTSAPGIDDLSIPVNALRITKSEPSPESELLRGVHQNATTYTLRVFHTGEGDIENVTVVDFLPAGLEYLGLGGVDNTTDANGTQGGPAEYPGAPSLSATTSSNPTWAHGIGDTVETVIPTPEEVTRYGLVAGAVYTKVTWSLGTLLATSDPRGTEAGVEQDYATTAGTPGVIEIRYRAGIPLFENTLDFGEDGAPTPESGEQAANLDNNRGASTRHGHPVGDDGPAPATSYRNVAAASGEYEGSVTEDVAAYQVDAVDLRVLKSVDSDVFTQSALARYTVGLRTSEYVSASVPAPHQEAFRFVDDFANGLCPVFPVGTPVIAGASTQGAGIPNLVLGDPRSVDAVHNQSIADWNAALAADGVNARCQWDPVSSPIPVAHGLEGVQLVSIAFDVATGHFFAEFALAIDPDDVIPAGTEHLVRYSARQNEAYLTSGAGATTSLDVLGNHVEVSARTASIPALDGVESAGSTHPDNVVPGDVAEGIWNAWDDSAASIRAGGAEFEKRVLQREAGVPANEDIADPGLESQWVAKADLPFAIGDEIWYRLLITTPDGADVRNPQLVDFLPPTVTYDNVDEDDDDRPDNIHVVASHMGGIGTCAPADETAWLNEFVKAPIVNGNVLNFRLGSADCLDSTDRFLPLGTKLAIYIKVTVTSLSPFGGVDVTANLAKYRQTNVHGEVFFLRDEAEFQVDHGSRMVKGIRSINGEPTLPDFPYGHPFNSDVDDLQVAQLDEVTFRLDITAPRVGTTDYVIWDALPIGITKDDIKGADPGTGAISAPDATSATMEQFWTAVSDPEDPLYPGLWLYDENPVASGWTATVYDFGEYPAAIVDDLRPSVAAEERSIIVWEFTGEVPASIIEETFPGYVRPPAIQGLTLGYTVIMPDGTGQSNAAQLIQEYLNDASIVRYSIANNHGGTTVLVPEGANTLSVREADEDAGEYPISDVQTFDPSGVYLPDAAIDKWLVSTEIGTNVAPNPPGGQNNLDSQNLDGDVVHGEHATFEYKVTIPAHTSVRGAVLADDGVFRWTGNPATPANRQIPYTFVAGSAVFTGPDPAFDFSDFTLAGVTGDPDHLPGTMVFPEEYQNATDEDQVFSVRITVWVRDRDAANPTYNPNFGNNLNLVNTASFAYDDPKGSGTLRLSDTETVRYREPNLAITKGATPTTGLHAGDPILYTITVLNNSNGTLSGTNNRVKTYDNVVVDTIPAGVIVDIDSASRVPFAYDPGVLDGTGGTITWHIAEIPATVTITYSATLASSAVAGETYRNDVTVEGFTLPSSLPDAADRRGNRTAAANASVRAILASIDKQVRTLPGGIFANTAQSPIGYEVEYRVNVTLHPGVNYYDPIITDVMPAGVELVEASVTGPAIDAPHELPGTWTPTHNAGTNTWTWTYDGDIAPADDERVLTLVYRVLLSNDVPNNVNDLDNTAGFSWNRINDDNPSRQTVNDGAEVDVQNPVLAIDKTVSEATPVPGDTFDYTVTVTNTGNAPAFNYVVTDTVPLGIVVDPNQLSLAGASIDNPTGLAVGAGGVITWTIPGPLHPLSSAGVPKEFSFSYVASLLPSASIADDQVFTNTAAVLHFESAPSGGREYDPDVDDQATVDPAFPHLTLDKSVTAGSVAYAEQSFGWTLTLVNTGDGPAQTVKVTDVLPKNWTYDADSATVTIGGGAPTAIEPVSSTDAAVQTLEWSLGAAAPASPLLPGTPAAAAARTIVITFTATPSLDALTDAGVGGTVPHTNTLSAVTTDPTGAEENASGGYTGPDDDADAFIHSADVEVIKTGGAGLVAGAPAGTAWTIEVRNNGPDTAVGPFLVTDLWGDAGVLPDGFTVTGHTGPGWDCTPIGTTGFSCVRTTPTDTLASGSSFPLITVTAQASAGYDVVADSPVPNRVTVTSGTHDTDETNNEDDAEVPVTASADLKITKTGPGTPPNAGEPINWTITLENLGPSDSLSVLGDQITITDTIPAGVTGVTVGALPAGWTASSMGPLEAGQTLTLTLDVGQRMTPSQAAAFSLSGTVLASHPSGTPIVNEVFVEPGPTPDPDGDNNEDDTSTTPSIDTTLGVSKTRQVFDDGAWRDATGADEAIPGESVTYLVTVSNTGLADARNVTVVDEVPAYLSYQSFVSVDGTWTRTSVAAGAGDDQTFVLSGDLVPGASASFRMTLLISSAHDDDVVNWVEADADNSTNQPRDDDNTGSSRTANLSIVKTHTPDAVAGETVAYRIVVTNEGPSYSSGPITITDLLPEGFSYEPDSAQVQIAGGAAQQVNPAPIAGQSLTWTIGDGSFTLADGATIQIDFGAFIDPEVTAGIYVNRADVDGPEDNDPSDNTDYEDTPVTVEAALSLTKSVEDGPWIAGTEVTYTITVVNDGPSVARDVTVTDDIPVGMTITGMSAAGWTCDIDLGRCDRALLPLGTFTITVVVLIDASIAEDTDLPNTAEVTASTPDPDLSDNVDDEEITVTAEADLALTKTAVDDSDAPITTADAGTTVRYSLVVQNLGPSDAVGPITIVDTLPTGFFFEGVEDASAPWTCAEDPLDASTVNCEYPTGLAAGDTLQRLVILVGIDSALELGEKVNRAEVSSPTTDPNPGNNDDDEPLDVTQLVDVSVVKSHDPDEVRIGDEFTFELVVANAGPSDATDIVVVDTLPAGLEYVSAGASDPAWDVVADPTDPDGGTTTVTATLTGSLPAGETAPTLQITVLVHVEAYPSVLNVASVSSEQPDADPDNNDTEDPVDVPPISTLIVTKEALTEFWVGSDARYLITVYNAGPTEDPGPIVITDDLPNGLRFVSASGPDAECAQVPGTVTIECTLIGPLAVEAFTTIEIRVSVRAAAFPEVVNTAVVSTPTEQTPDSKLTDTVVTPVHIDPLSGTGSELAPIWVMMGLMMVLGGGVLLLGGRRRRTA